MMYEGGTKSYAPCCSRLISHTIQYFTVLFFIPSDATYSEDHLLQKSLHKTHNNYGIRRKIETLPSIAVRTQRVLKLYALNFKFD